MCALDPAEHSGTSLAAANWSRVGLTAGRGRFAASGAAPPTKSVWLRPLAKNWRRGLGAAPRRPAPLSCGAGLDRTCWAENEFGKTARSRSNWKRRSASSACTIRWQPLSRQSRSNTSAGPIWRTSAPSSPSPAPRLGGEHHELLGEAACGLEQTLECACFLEMVEAAEGRDDALSDLFAVAVVFDDLDIGTWPTDFGAAEHGASP